MKDQPLVVERIYDAPIKNVWEALTNVEQMRQWYFKLEDFKPEIGFDFQFTAGNDAANQYLHLCKITQVIPGKKIAYSWRYDKVKGDSEVSFELFDMGEQTKLVLTHIGLNSFDTANPDFAKTSFEGGWNYFVNTALKGFLDK